MRCCYAARRIFFVQNMSDIVISNLLAGYTLVKVPKYVLHTRIVTPGRLFSFFCNSNSRHRLVGIPLVKSTHSALRTNNVCEVGNRTNHLNAVYLLVRTRNFCWQNFQRKNNCKLAIRGVFRSFGGFFENTRVRGVGGGE